MKTLFFKLKQPYLWPLLLLPAANGLIATDIVDLRYCAALILLAFLPGWVWLNALDPPTGFAGRVTLAIGLSLALSIFGAMFAVYLPGPLTTGQLLLTIDAIIVAGAAAARRRPSRRAAPPLPPPVTFPARNRLIIPALLVLLILLAAAVRLPRLGYAEFHEDEAETLMLGVRLLQGEDYAMFLHRKGPAQMLLPVAFWLFTGRITETLARFPFALSSILSVATLFFMGRRWFGWPAGVAAGLLWAVNGYAIAFGRMVQYQALIFFLGPLAVYSLYLAWKHHRPRLQILAAVLLAACLLAHFDALLLLPVAGYLFILATFLPMSTRRRRARRIASALALAIFLALLASFYIPYLLDPEFKNTAGYLAESRVKPGLLYNNLNLLRRFDKNYSSHFYLPLLAVGLAGFVIRQAKRRTGHTPATAVTMAGLGLLLASTVWLPDIWRIGPWSLAVLPWLAALIWGWVSAGPESRAAWLMFGAALTGYVFLVDDPRTHLYIIYPGAALLAGAGWAHIARWNRPPPDSVDPPSERTSAPASLLFLPTRMLPPLLIGGGLLVIGAVIFYDGAIFLQTESAVTRLRAQWDASPWAAVYNDLPKARSYFGYPKREGWKAIGAQRAQGAITRRFSQRQRGVHHSHLVQLRAGPFVLHEPSPLLCPPDGRMTGQYRRPPTSKWPGWNGKGK